jgi:hypothetical protein
VNDTMLSPQQPLSIEPPRRDRIAAISGVVQRKPIVLVLGMHRSGTSLCSHLLSALGVDMADQIPGPGHTSLAPDNPRGHWERWEIVEFHDRILHLFNRDYFGRFHDFALPAAWWADPRVAQIRREIVAYLEKRMGDGYFGFKDPRTIRLMPVWHQIINELKLAPKVVLCLRNPAQVARSLHARDGLDPANGEYRWLVHMIDFFRYASNLDFCAVEYEEWFDNPAANIERLRKFLDVPWQQSESDLALLLSDIIDPSLRHDDPGRRDAGQPLVRTLYKLASRAGQDGTRDQIAYIVSQFVSFQQVQRPLLQAFEGVAKTAAKYPEIEQEATALRAAVSERDAIIETAEHRASSAEGRLADAVAEIEAQRAQIAELAVELEARVEFEREASGLRATLAGREWAFAELSRGTHELLAAQQAAQAELAAREAALLHSERTVQERAAAAEAMQAEVGALRQTLTQAERKAQERDAAAAGLQAEIGGLQETLTAARQVGKGAIAALHIGSVAVTKPDRQRGGRRAVVRFLGGGLIRRTRGFIALANRARDAGEWGLAACLYRKALARDSRHPAIWVQYGHALKESGEQRDPDKLAQAEIAYRKALSLDPSVADTYLQLGHTLKLQDKTDKAQACYLRAFVLNPSTSYPLQELAGLGWSEAHINELRNSLGVDTPLSQV